VLSGEESARIIAEVEAEFGPVPRQTRDQALREQAMEDRAASRADWREPPEPWDALLGRNP
jgi:hypothetical protein